MLLRIMSFNTQHCLNFITRQIDFDRMAQAIDAGNGNPYGNGLISRYPLLSAETIPVPDPEKTGDYFYESRCLLKAKIAVGEGLNMLVIHFGLAPAEQENAVATVMQHMETENCILMGDFNVCPDHPVLAPIRGAFRDAADLFDQEKLSFPSDHPDRKIDYIFATPDVAIQSADIPAIVASDHRPHTAAINI